MVEKRLVARINRAGYHGFSIENIFFNLEPGEILLVTGRSGSGKTTLLKTLAGLILVSKGFFNGKILLGEKNLYKLSIEERSRHIMYMAQEPWYSIIGYTVETEYCHTLSIHGVSCDTNVLDKYGLYRLRKRITYGLSAGEYQRILWAEILETRPDILLLDEPYTYIDLHTRSLFKEYLVKYLNENGMVIVVDHIPGNWADLEPRLLVLEDGRIKYFGEYRELDAPSISYEKRGYSGSRETLVETHGVWYRYLGGNIVLKGVDIEVGRGEVIGVRGVNGAGKTTLLKILAGLYKAWRGSVKRYGSPIYIPENPLLYFSYPTPREELYSSTVSRDEVDVLVREFGLENILDRPLALLSSGERRRVALLSAMLSNYDLYLLDEPSGGLDIYSLSKLLDLIDYLRGRGCGVVIAHHDPRLEKVFDREYVLEGGVLKRI